MYLVRVVFLKALAFIYGIAFTVAYKQNKALIGDNGITPAREVLKQAENRGEMKRKSRTEWLADGGLEDGKFQNPIVKSVASNPLAQKVIADGRVQRMCERLWDRSDSAGRPVTTLLWLARDRFNLNPWLDGIAIAGISMASLVFYHGAANAPLLLGLWLCQRSLWAVGGPWYAYGWEPQLAELGFHALFLVPLRSMNPFGAPPVPGIVAWTIRWYLFRIMLGAGLIKMKGGKQWKDLSAMYYHYETQPVPNPLSKYFHFAPNWWHRWEVLTNHFVELIGPFLLLMPFRPLRLAGGIIQMSFQAVLILSGNLSFLNWLTAIPALFCFDDKFLSRFFSYGEVAAATAAHNIDAFLPASTARRIVSLLFGLLIARLSVPVVKNLLAKQQLMNGSFDPLRLVNTYGAFGTVNEEREELVVSSAMDAMGEWKEYEFPVKPGDPEKRPRWISPYHYRLDWQMWIASAMGSISRSRWMYTFLTKILEGDQHVIKTLLAKDPWEGLTPKYIRVDRYRYKFSPKSNDGTKGPYWDREFLGRWYPTQGVTTLDSLKSELARFE